MDMEEELNNNEEQLPEENSENLNSEEIQEEELSVTIEPAESHHTITLSGMYKDWFLDYASYVILERAVPEINDGLKPVQRRILHSMYELEDGRYNKVANVIGHTMKYHPHGDASIGDAMVQIGQKDLMIDTQGNWGNILTGDSAAAPRYIEARLSKFAQEVAFNPKVTQWKPSYDGRNKEPIALPMKFPLLLAQGVEGIAVGLASKILPHNFVELIDGSIAILKNEPFILLPDFPTGGLADFSKYNDGIRTGKVRIRARINHLDKKTLVINEIPFGTTTGDLIDTIISANEKGKIKIRKIDDNTAGSVEILVHLQPGTSPDQTIDALYAFTDCERSESPNSCVIIAGKPRFIGVSEILKISTDNTVKMLKAELEYELNELREKHFFSSLLKIFINEGMYKHPEYENSGSFEIVCKVLRKLFEPFLDQLIRPITDEDFKKLIDKPMSSITRFDTKKADEHLKNLQNAIKGVQFNLAHLIEYTIGFYEEIKRKYAAGRERKTEIRNFEQIEAAAVAAANVKLYVNREEGFAGSALKKDEYVCECSDIDDIIVFREDGTFIVTKVAEKTFVGKNVLHIDVFKKNDDRTVYNMAYQDGKAGAVYVKRFSVTGIVRDKEYNLTKGTAGSKVMYFTANPNGESEVIRYFLKPKPRLKKLQLDFDFSTLAIKGRSSMGNVLSKNAVKKIIQAEKGLSTLSARDIYYDDTVMRLNTDGRGKHLGAFKDSDKILSIMASGHYKLTGFDLSTHFDEDMIILEKFNPRKPVTAVYLSDTKGTMFVKRFIIDPTDKKTLFLPEEEEVKLVGISTDYMPVLQVSYNTEGVKKAVEAEQTLSLDAFVEVMKVKAKGKKLGNLPVLSAVFGEPEPFEEEIIAETEEELEISEEETDETGEETDIAEASNLDDLLPPRNDDEPEPDGGQGIQMTLF